MSIPLEFREMVGLAAGGLHLLDAVETGRDASHRHLSFYFAAGTDPGSIGFPEGAERVAQFTIGNALVIRLSLPIQAQLVITMNGEATEPAINFPELEPFAGKNAAAALRNGQSAETVLEWLAFNAERQGMTAAVILDRAAPGSDPDFDRELAEGLATMSDPPRGTVLRSPLPLGQPGLPPEAHPYCAPAAPGRDRMKVPPEDPWRAPIGALCVHEIMRERFLARARAVANIDVSDLILDQGPDTIFDRAAAAPDGVIQLEGHPCYPWRVRNDDPPRFADHICVQFDQGRPNRRWCIAPARAPEKAVWRLTRVGNAAVDPGTSGRFFRFMGLRHPTDGVAQIVPKSALIEDKELLQLSKKHFGHKPVRVPEVSLKPVDPGRGHRTIVTTMKNEGPFILEWLAYHRAIGFDSFLIYTNDCTDGTDDMLDLLQRKGLVQHRDNPFRQSGMKPQHAALAAAPDEEVIATAKWLVCIDVDEFINIKAGDGTLDALFAAVPDANMISMTWRLFGNSDRHAFVDLPITEQFTRCAPELTRKPHVAWGFKTLFQNRGIFKKLGVHRPKGLFPQLKNRLNWVNGSGLTMPETMYRNAWRSTTRTYGYDLVQLNHYAVRSAESFLVKRDRGRVNHVDRDQGLAYWFRMNNNADEDLSIQRMLPAMREELDKFMADPEIAAAHAHSVAQHRSKIDALRTTEKYSEFFADLTGARLQKLSRMHSHFGTNVFLSGPDCVPEEIVARDPDEEFFFTVDRGATVHS